MPSTKLAAQLRRKEAVNYEDDTPRCNNCVNKGFNREAVLICKKHSFSVTPVSLCDDWEGKNGDRLEKDK